MAAPLLALLKMEIAKRAVGYAIKKLTKKDKEVKFLNGFKTYIGLVIAILPAVAKLFGYDVDGNFDVDAGNLINEAITVLGGAIAFYGRAKTEGKSLFVKKK